MGHTSHEAEAEAEAEVKDTFQTMRMYQMNVVKVEVDDHMGMDSNRKELGKEHWEAAEDADKKDTCMDQEGIHQIGYVVVIGRTLDQ